MKYFFWIATLFLASCADEQQPSSAGNTNNPVKIKAANTVRTAIGNTGYFIDLPSTHFIKADTSGSDFYVYYVIPNDTTTHPGEAGFYIGHHPYIDPPAKQYTKKEFSGNFLLQAVKWTEYTTSENVQRETFVETGDGQKVHCWCYSSDPGELERLFTMIQSIGR